MCVYVYYANQISRPKKCQSVVLTENENTHFFDCRPLWSIRHTYKLIKWMAAFHLKSESVLNPSHSINSGQFGRLLCNMRHAIKTHTDHLLTTGVATLSILWKYFSILLSSFELHYERCHWLLRHDILIEFSVKTCILIELIEYHLFCHSNDISLRTSMIQFFLLTFVASLERKIEETLVFFK